MPLRRAASSCLLGAWLVLSGCASQRVPAVATPDERPPSAAATPAPDPASSPGEATSTAETSSTSETPPTADAAPMPETPPSGGASSSPPGKVSLRDLCRMKKPEEEPTLDAVRRRIHETVCGANLWFDGLFGERMDVANARAVSGWIEGSDLYSQAEGNQLKLRVRLRYDLPNLENRVALFLGRGDERELIEDRIEGMAVRSSIFGLESQDDWLAGLGYAPPGKLGSRFDLRLGARLSSEPRVYVQGRYRRDFLVGEKSAIRLRETVFWENRENGFGTTLSADFEHLLNPRMLFRWNNLATLSQGTEGTRWRTGLFVYQGLEHRRALLYQIFVRGETAAEVPLREYGGRTAFRMSFGRPWLYGNFTVGYSWPRFEREEERTGSALVGFGIEMQFGENPR